MTDLNEKLKIVATYIGLSPNSKFVPRYQTDYNDQIPVWQKVLKEIESHNFEYMSTEWQRFGELWTLYHDAIDKAAPLESFEILVRAIQFINNLKTAFAAAPKIANQQSKTEIT